MAGESIVHRRSPVGGAIRFPLKWDRIGPIFRGHGISPGMGEFHMANWSDPRIGAGSQPTTTAGRDVAFDAGLRAHMLSVYNYMGSGVLLTGIVSMLFATSGLVMSLINPATGGLSGLGYLLMFAPLGIVLWMSFGINRISTTTAQILFWSYAALVGASLSTIFLVYTPGSIATTFFATAVAFLGLSLFGYSTKRDLSAIGTFLIMGLFGLIAAMLLTALIPGENPAVTMAISAIGVLIFAGLTAYDTQKIKSMYFAAAGTDQHTKVKIMGALNLYLDFLNMFLFLLRFMGSRN
jgi:FtsH-binding integral membrane protein